MYGKVVDFFNINFFNIYIFNRTIGNYVFNIADLAITAGVLIVNLLI
jgi:lipoprotein signal peptidase